MKKKNKKKPIKKLNKAFKAKWLKALRSGRYEQGRHVLRTSMPGNKYAYCCLGVACNITDRHWTTCRGNLYINKYSDPLGTSLNLQFLREINLSALIEHELICMNDSGKSFNEIADYIEKKL